jgi:hypothetical protein
VLRGRWRRRRRRALVSPPPSPGSSRVDCCALPANSWCRRHGLLDQWRRSVADGIDGGRWITSVASFAISGRYIYDVSYGKFLRSLKRCLPSEVLLFHSFAAGLISQPNIGRLLVCLLPTFEIFTHRFSNGWINVHFSRLFERRFTVLRSAQDHFIYDSAELSATVLFEKRFVFEQSPAIPLS